MGTLVPARLAIVIATTAFVICAFPRPSAAQEMIISIHEDTWTSANHDTFYTVATGIDDSWGCTHTGYWTDLYISGPDGSASGWDWGAQTSLSLPNHSGGTYDIYSSLNFDCTCIQDAWTFDDFVQVQVPPPIPTGETITFLGWQGGGGISMWYQFLQPSNVNFAGRTVREVSGTGTDLCHFEGSARPPFTALTGGDWTVQADNGWGPDYLSWAADDITYYRAQGKAPCSTTIPQSMRINVPGQGYVEYLNHNLIFTIGVTSVTYQRGYADPASKDWP